MALKRLRFLEVFFFKEFVKGMVFFLPTSKALSFNWNFGMVLGSIFGLQLITGVFLVFYYSPDSGLAFSNVQNLMVKRKLGRKLRIVYFNGGRLFFFFFFFICTFLKGCFLEGIV